MKAKAALLTGLAVGYVLGTRDGRERYEQIKTQANKAWRNPRVQETADKAQAKAQDAVKQATESVQHKLKDEPTGPDAVSDDAVAAAPSLQESSR